MDGFCETEVNPFGPLQLYDVPELFAVSDNVCPEQIGELLPAVGIDGGAFTITFVVLTLLTHPADEIAVTEYVPASAEETFVIVGF